MKKFLISLLTILMLISLTSCNEQGPEATLESAMKSFQKTDSLMSLLENFTAESQAEMTQTITNELGDIDIDDMLYIDTLYKKLNPSLMKNLSYEIIDVEENEDSALVNVRVTNMDFKPVLNDFMPKFISYIMTLYLTEDMNEIESMTEDEQLEYSKEYINEVVDLMVESVESVEDVNLITNEVSVNMTKSEDGKWYIDDPEFLLYLLGNIEDSMEATLEDFGANLGFELE